MARQWHAHNAQLSIIATCVMVLALTACGTAQPEPPAETAATSERALPRSTSSEPSTPEASTAAPVYTDDLGNCESYETGPKTVVTACDDSDEDGHDLMVYGSSATPGSVTVDVDGEREISEIEFAAEQHPAADPRVIVGTAERVQAQGLQAETTEIRAHIFDDSGALRKEFTLANSPDLWLGEIVLVGEVFLVSSSGSDDEDIMTAYSSEDGAQLWTQPFTGESHDGEGYELVGRNLDTVVLNDPEYDLDQLNAFDLATGKKLWSREGTSAARAGEDHVALWDQSDYPDQSGIYSVPELSEVRTGIADPPLTDPITGASLLQVTSEDSSDDDPKWVITDRTFKTEAFSLTVSEFYALGEPQILALFDGRLWFSGSDGLDVVSLSTGERDALAPEHPGDTSEYEKYENVPFEAMQNWVILTTVSSFTTETPATLIRSPERPLAVEDLPPTTVAQY